MGKRKLTVAAFGAHPDDIEYLMMGTLIKYKEQGHHVHIVVVSDGRRGGRVVTPDTPKIRREEATRAAAHIGVTPVFVEAEDGRVIYDDVTYRKLIDVYEKIKPDVVFTLHPDDYHADHRAVSRLVCDVSWVPVFMSDTSMGINFNPQFYVDITDQFELKKKCLSEHVSQDGERLCASMEIQARFRGLQTTPNPYEMAEAYCLYRNKFNFARAPLLLPEEKPLGESPIINH